MLPVTRVSPRATAGPAMSTSNGPIGRPAAARWARIRPASRASSRLSSTTGRPISSTSARTEANLALVEEIGLPVVELSREDAREAGRIRAHLAAAGRPIGPFDVLIAGQAVARGLTLVTGNIGEFARVDGLAIQDWSG